MDILSNATKHWRDRLEGEFVEIEVPEWGDENGPARLYFSPANVAQRARIQRALDDKGAYAAFVETIITRAKNSNGTKAFVPNNQTRDIFNKELDPDVITRIVAKVNQAFADDEISVEDAEKN